jgi:lipopolysaccharide transport system permease protein
MPAAPAIPPPAAAARPPISVISDSLSIRIIQPSRNWAALNLAELWEYRELVYLMVWRELKVRYKQTMLGVAWAIVQPFFTMIVFSVIFGRLAGLPSDGLPYPVFSFAALLPWQLFSLALNESSNSVVTNQRLLTKIYFPRLLLPISAVAVALSDFGISFVFLLGMMAYYGVVPSVAIVTIPLWTMLAIVSALGIGLWLAALNVRYRDIRYTLPFLTQIWLYATPIAYSSSLIPERWRPLYALNPMVGVVEGFRWALLGSGSLPGTMLMVSTGAVLAILVSGLIYFRTTERTFADVV